MTDDEARAILREHGEQPPERGRLSAAWHEAAEAIASSVITGADPGGPADGSRDAGTGAGDDAGSATPPPADDTLEGRPVAAESRPRRPSSARRRRGARSGGGAQKLRDTLWGGGAQKPRKPPRPKRDRIPLDRVCQGAWRGLGKASAYVSLPLSRTIDLQAPFAGVVLEDTIRDTFFDTLLQPVARAQDKGRNLFGLFGPPMIVMALESAKGLPEQQRNMRAAFLLPLLEESLVTCAKISGERAETIQARADEDEPLRQAVRAQIAMIFAGPPSATMADAEDQAAG